MYELIYISVIPGKLDSFEQCFVASVNLTNNKHQLLGVWRTEIGELNQAIHLWQLESNEKDLSKLYTNPKIADVIVSRKSRTITPAPFSIDLTHPGPPSLAEIRIYKYQRDAIPEVIEKWSIKITERLQLSTMLMCGFTESGSVCEWIHIWPYENILDRQQIRQDAIDKNIWPPGAFRGLISQSNLIIIPAKYLLK